MSNMHTRQEIATINDAWGELMHTAETTDWRTPADLKASLADEKRECKEMAWAKILVMRAFLHGWDAPDMPAVHIAGIRMGVVRATLLGIDTVTTTRRRHFEAAIPKMRAAVAAHDGACKRERARSVANAANGE